MSSEATAPASSSPASRLVPILENVPLARDTYRLRLDDPLLAQAILPGQFLMVRPGAEGADDPLLGRPFALYDVVLDAAGHPTAVDLVYLIVGRGTACLARRKPGERLIVWGPLGNGFTPAAPVGPVLFVAGGIGQTPFLALGRWWLGKASYGKKQQEAFSSSTPGITRVFSPSATLLYGVRTAALLAGVNDFRQAGIEVEIATDDGSAGHHGLVTDLLARHLAQVVRPARIVGCGPAAMLSALARLAERQGIPCDVSLENHMACGFGACFSCVAPIRQTNGSSDLRRVCIEGPVFAARSVDWSSLRL